MLEVVSILRRIAAPVHCQSQYSVVAEGLVLLLGLRCGVAVLIHPALQIRRAFVYRTVYRS